MIDSITNMVNQQRAFFLSGETKSISFRKKQLKQLLALIKNNEAEIYEALSKDLHKSTFETYITEIMPLIKEIKLYLKKIDTWAKPRKVRTPISISPGTSTIYPQPYGVVLNIAPWNYPVQLSFSLLIPILAAGNCAVIKPSEHAPHSSALVARLVKEHFPSHYCAVIEGEIKETTKLLDQKWDFIAFTGSPKVGRIVASKAAKNLTPQLLELGGKSPVIVHSDADIKVAARRIVWGKYSNAGQICTAPDFLLAEKSIMKQLTDAIIKEIKNFYSNNPQESPDYCRIINRKHFDRLSIHLQSDALIYGGARDEHTCYISPSVLYNVSWDDPIMDEEIFGPLLPVIEYDGINSVIHRLQERERPLALYLFTKDKKIQQKTIQSISFGGGCINATMFHYANDRLPFGGVGNSGMGRYHGKTGFDTFSYEKSIFKKPTAIDPDLIYPPYSENKLKMVKLFT